MSVSYPRDLVGYGAAPPDPRWPGGARLAVQFVLNYEEGGEACVLHGDDASEAWLTDVVSAVPWSGRRNLNVESQFEYGSRAGFWRILRIFAERGVRLTAFAVGMALERHPQAARALVDAGHEVASHGYRWIDYSQADEEREREHLALAIDAIERTCGVRPVGWYTGRPSGHVRRLLVEDGGFLYDSDAYNDDLPYWDGSHGRAHLVIPYTYENNDFRFVSPQGFSSGEDFLAQLTSCFDLLYAEGGRMMSVGLHNRLIGKPGRAGYLARFLDHVLAHDDVWIARRDEIARHWARVHPPEAPR